MNKDSKLDGTKVCIAYEIDCVHGLGSDGYGYCGNCKHKITCTFSRVECGIFQQEIIQDRRCQPCMDREIYPRKKLFLNYR